MKNTFKKITVLTLLVMIMTSLLSVNAFAWGGYNDSDNGKGNNTNNKNVNFYIQLNGEQMDSHGNISGRDASFFTGKIAETTLKKNPDKNMAIGNGVTEKDILSYLNSTPSSNDAFKKVVSEYSGRDAYICSSNGKVIPWSKLTTAYYKIQWYVLKLESDAWHVDGVIIDLETDKEISIVVPDESAKRASCVEYDVQTGTFTPGVMSVRANRPHSYWQGDNDTLVIDGFNDVWYTVLNEDSFNANNYVIPSNLINAATAIEALSGARLSELPLKLQREYGRIDSQAYKSEYIERTGAGTTLYVTPFITELLSKKYDVNTDKYIWLAIGDSDGNILKVYVMDRDTANVDNLFDEE